MKIKVCGITTYDDAAMALDLGADALGFNFYPNSPRFLPPPSAGEIVRRLPPFAVSVAVFVNLADTLEVERQARIAGVQVLQLHGDESPEYCLRLQAWKLIKALRLCPDSILEEAGQYPVAAFLLDARDNTRYGGTGTTFDWRIAGRLRTTRPVILAGGLCPENVGEAIRIVRPYAVDVCSGVESAPGRKDQRRLSAFIREAKNAAGEIPNSGTAPA
ncbi:MAG: phosphoribosylanthranilate isomerase [Acidobacteria bacterium]|nr:phosphoribosylanthranilate isomerase [Acidobacteriota bacterium]